MSDSGSTAAIIVVVVFLVVFVLVGIYLSVKIVREKVSVCARKLAAESFSRKPVHSGSDGYRTPWEMEKHITGRIALHCPFPWYATAAQVIVQLGGVTCRFADWPRTYSVRYYISNASGNLRLVDKANQKTVSLQNEGS